MSTRTCQYCQDVVSKSTYYDKHHNGYCLKWKTRKILHVKPKKVQPSLESQIELQLVTAVDNDKDNGKSGVSNDGGDIKTDISFQEQEANVYLSGQDDEDHFSEDESVDMDEEIWEDDEEPLFEFNDKNEQRQGNYIITSLLKMLLVWQLNHHISAAAMEVLLKILLKCFQCIKLVSECAVIDEIISIFPTTVKKAHEILSVQSDDFEKAVACSSCSSIYRSTDVLKQDLLGNIRPIKCTFIRFPSHPQQKYRHPCNIELMKSVLSIDGKKKYFYPKMVYCYRSIKKSLSDLLSNKNFVKLLHHEKMYDECGNYTDIIDGNVFKQFDDGNGNWFFSDKRNIGCIVNIDWFNPFKNQHYSMGVIYMAFVNIPRHERFKWENVIVLAIIPGPKEPRFTVNTYLDPIVEELIELWYGVPLKECGILALYRLAIICISSDIPATRKLCGFKSHNALKGCSKCHSTFDRNESNVPCYAVFDDTKFIARCDDEHKILGCSKCHSTFDRNESNVPCYAVFDDTKFIARCDDEHKILGAQSEKFNTLDAVARFEKEHGVRYSALFKLPYFRPVTTHVIDPMHTLLLGVSKHVFFVWIEKNILNQAKLGRIDENLKRVQLPSDLGRIASSMSTNYKCLKADEWKHWTLVYSLFCLKDVIEEKYFVNWTFFVRACLLLCQRSITESDVNLAHQLLKSFCIRFVDLYGTEHCVPNMHFMLHIKECILNFGSVYSFWCFSFERFNGIMGSFKTNNHSVEVQVMKKFVLKTQLQMLPDEGPSNEKMLSIYNSKHRKIFNNEKISFEDINFKLDIPVSTAFSYALTHETVASLKVLFGEMVSLNVNIRFSFFSKKYKRVSMNNETYSIFDYRCGSFRNCYINVRVSPNEKYFRQAIIKEIFSVNTFMTSNEEEVVSDVLVCRVDLFKEHPHKHFYGYNCPLKIWDLLTEEASIYVPVKFIRQRVALIKENIRFPGPLRNSSETVFVVVPLPSKSIA